MAAGGSRAVLGLWLLAAGLCGAVAASRSPSCHEVRTAFQLRQIGPLKLVPDVPTAAKYFNGNADDDTVSPLSCCSSIALSEHPIREPKDRVYLPVSGWEMALIKWRRIGNTFYHEHVNIFEIFCAFPPYMEITMAESDLQICQHRAPTCCTKKMEESYQAAVRRERTQSIQALNFELKYMIVGHITAFQVGFCALLTLELKVGQDAEFGFGSRQKLFPTEREALLECFCPPPFQSTSDLCSPAGVGAGLVDAVQGWNIPSQL
ncbi:hypothetical protein TURU_084472 [Turdus rufiventris]|nr:hypothetical protein TURU_084472 [Turdus rufiventris]